MKKLLIGLLFISFLVSCSSNYDDWKEISIDSFGTIKVPNNWIFTIKDNIIYFTDKPISEKEYKIFLVGTTYDEWQEHPNSLLSIGVLKNAVYKDVLYLRNEPSTGTEYGQYFYEINGQEEKKYFTWVSSTELYLYMIAWDDLIDEETIEKIVKSFISE